MRTTRALALAIVALPILLLIVAAGCGSDQKSHSVEQKDFAKKQWAGARANVLGSLAKEQYENGNFDKCRQTITDALKIDPENVGRLMAEAKGVD